MKTNLTKKPKHKPRTVTLASRDRILLLAEEYVETVYAQHASGPGWANEPLWIIIINYVTGKMRRVCLQPKNQTEEMRVLFRFSALAHLNMRAAVERVCVKDKDAWGTNP